MSSALALRGGRSGTAGDGTDSPTKGRGSSSRGPGGREGATTTMKLPAIPVEKGALPPSTAGAGGGGGRDGGGAMVPHANPFHMPSDDEIFSMRDMERRHKKEERQRQRTLKVHEKGSRRARPNAKAILADEEDQEIAELLANKEDTTQSTLLATRDRHVEKENLADFIAKKREMFLVQYSLGVKRDEMRKLEEIAQAEERKLLEDEKALEEDAAKFDAFLKENDKNSVEAIKRAEAETKAKLEKVSEIKRINAAIMAMKSEMSKSEDQLREYQMYKEFLDKLTPPEFFEALVAEREMRRKERAAQKARDKQLKASAAAAGGASEGPHGDEEGAIVKSRPSQDSVRSASRKGEDRRLSEASEARSEKGGGAGAGAGGALSDSDDEDLEPALYFKEPQQLLDIFAELEEQNLSLIQNSQETEEALEELKQKIGDTEERMNRETENLKGQIEYLEHAIDQENQRAADLEQRAQFFSFGVLGVEDQETQLEELNKKVEEVYRNCIGDNEASIGTLQMLTNIENKLEELFGTIEMMPVEKVAEAERMKDKERRQRHREEKLEAQRLHQEDRVKRAWMRAKAPVNKKTGKPLVFRSAPPQKKKKSKEDEERKNEEEEEMKYYFT